MPCHTSVVHCLWSCHSSKIQLSLVFPNWCLVATRTHKTLLNAFCILHNYCKWELIFKNKLGTIRATDLYAVALNTLFRTEIVKIALKVNRHLLLLTTEAISQICRSASSGQPVINYVRLVLHFMAVRKLKVRLLRNVTRRYLVKTQ